ncbi:efflux RND transporter permease subunit [Elongatibacter sediminis]|uniref:Efflux RND transporter permease subunit n=1 Tax=Elongatibacter sediminis TaxID=3119006 RepID=A0AAW9RD78_9GAMM
MSPARIALRRPVTVIMAFVSLLAVGAIATRLLPLEFFPAVDVPFIMVDIPYQGSTPAEVEREITRPAEEVIATLSGIKRLQSFSTATGARLEVIFDWESDVAVKAVEARERIEAIRDQLPSDLRRINVLKFNLTDQPVLTLRISSERDLSTAYDMLMRRLVRPLERIPGVARVDFQGIEPREIRIELNADRVIAHGIDLADLQRRLQQVNFSDSAGLIRDGGIRYRVNPRGEFRSVGEIGELIISDSGLRLKDIAEVTYDSSRRNYARHLDRKYAIGVSIFKENGANLVEVGKRVLDEVNRIGETPEMHGIQLFFLENQAEGVTESLSELLKAGLVGALLSLGVLYFFLRHVPTTLMVSLAVPLAITITLGAMYFLGLSLNILSMMGLMLAIGMLVDNSVVVSESIHTERGRTPDDPKGAALRGVRAVGLAVAAGTLTSAAVFLPIIFGEKDQIAIFLTHVAVAIVVSLSVSLLIAQTLIPLVASRLPVPARRSSGLIERLKRRYVRLLRWNMRHRWLASLAVLAALASVAVPISLVETDMFPQNDTRKLFLNYHLDGNYPLDKVKQAVDTIENYLYENQERFEISAVYTYYNEEGEAISSVLLTDDSEAERSAREITDDILANLPKIAIGRPSFSFERVGGNEKLGIVLRGRSSEVLGGLADDVIRVLSGAEGLTGVVASTTAGDQELQVRVNRERANLMGFSTQQVAEAVAIAIRGVDLREFKGEEGEISVRLQFREEDRENLDDLKDLKIRNEAGVAIPLMALVEIERNSSPARIQRIDRQTGVNITANLDGISSDRAREVIEQRMNLLELPAGYSWSFGRGFDDDAEAMQKMLFNILLAIAIIYIVLAAQFESLIYPVSMVCTILFSIVGVYWFFLATGTTFSIMSMIGILILIGVVVNNGIVLIDHVNQLRLQGLGRDEALVQAGNDRLRPILMTVGTTVLGLTPLCIGTTQLGGDGPPYFPMARAIVGGLLFSTVVSLVFLPTIYTWLDAMRAWPAVLVRVCRWSAGRAAHWLAWPVRRVLRLIRPAQPTS